MKVAITADHAGSLLLTPVLEEVRRLGHDAVGASVAANKVRGIRAALCHDTYSAHQGVEHDQMNVLCLGARVIGEALALELVRAFLAASFSGEPRHRRRLEKIAAMEAKF